MNTRIRIALPPCRAPRGTPGLCHAARALALIVFAVLTLSASTAMALSIQLDFTRTTYQTLAGDTFADLLAEHQAGVFISSSVETAAQGVSLAAATPGGNRDYSLLITTVLDVTTGGVFEFQVGTDWGRGGASVVIDNGTGLIIDEFVTTQDIWWNNDWNNPDVFSSQVTLDAGSSYTLAWVGFEGCCAGSATIRFSYAGGAFQTLDAPNIDPYVVTIPEPGTAVLVGVGLAILSARRRRQ